MLKSSSQCSKNFSSRVPKADFYTNDEELLILIDLPGASNDDVSVTFRQGRLWVEAGNSTGKESMRRRAFRISDLYEPENTRATVDRGVVRLEVPKRPEAKTVRIPVNAA